MGAWDSTRKFFNSIPVAGGLTQSIFGSPEQEESARTASRIQQELEASRPENAAQRMRVAQQSALAFAPLGNMMEGMYGPGARIDTQAMLRNPLMSPNAQHPAFRAPLNAPMAHGGGPTAGDATGFPGSPQQPQQVPQGVPMQPAFAPPRGR
jgi:hypothetical protein